MDLKQKTQHVGMGASRLAPDQNNPREVAFAGQWQEENENGQILNILCGLGPQKELSDRDIQVAATVIQWLGSNIGMAFQMMVYKRNPIEFDRWHGKQVGPRVDDLSLLIKRLVNALQGVAPDNKLSEMAMDYLVRNGLQGDVLRVG